MTWWASGDAREVTGPQGQEITRRPDRRLLGRTRAGVGPAPAQGVFIGRLVIVSGTGVTSGVFIYNGTPAPGNPPQIAMVPTGVTTDPYGNAITSSKILMQGNVITESGGIFRTAAVAPLVQLDGPHDALLIYDAAGNLTETAAPVQTTDGLGHTVYAGIVNYNTAISAIVQMLGGTFNFGSPAQIGLTGGKQPGSVGLTAVTEGTAQISTGVNGGTDTAATLLLWSKNAGGAGQPFAQLQTVLELAAPVTVAQQGDTVLYDNSATSFPLFKPGTITGDTTTYQIGHRVFFNGSDQLVNSTTFATVCGGGAAAGNANYLVRAVLTVVQGPNVAANDFRLGFTGTITAVRMKATFMQDNTSVFVATTTSNNGLLASHAYGAGTTYVAEFEGVIETSSSGTLSMQAAMNAAGNTFTVLALSDFNVTPIN